MPELVSGGPDIPPQLMNDLDDGKVVFFCGAEISMGPESNLPSFEGLVCKVYTDCGRARPAQEERPRELDRELDLLEQKLAQEQVRKSVVNQLSTKPSRSLVVHKALIDLSRTTKGWRLVTTNFDNRFLEAGLNEGSIDVAPRLPVPKPHNWSTLVHLHGRIPYPDSSDADGSSLVLTSADFGRAYLVERWAARFVTELFHNFTVVFVGYGLSDPVMRYLTDALDAERRRGGRIEPAYAFTDSISEAREPWRSKNVNPIIYDAPDGDHRLLRNTLVAWARIRADPQARTRIALDGITKLTSPIGDRDVARVTWALQDPQVAQALADAPPLTEEQDFWKIEAWLSEFQKTGLLGQVDRDFLCDATRQVSLVDSGPLSQSPPGVDRVGAHLARWIARHLHVPQVLAWVVERGGRLHHELSREIRRSLASADHSPTIHPRLRHLWTVLVDSPNTDPWSFVFQASQYSQAATDSEKRRLEEATIRNLAPRLIVRQGPSDFTRVSRWTEHEPTPITPLEACGHLRIQLGNNDVRQEAQRLLADKVVLSRQAQRLTDYLEDAIVFLPDDDDVPTDEKDHLPSWVRPWIAADSDPDFDGWIWLIDLVRDSYFALVECDLGHASRLLGRWARSESALFQRLALHAITEDRSADISLADHLLLSGSNPGIWRRNLRNEILRFLNMAGSHLPKILCSSIVRAILAGPIGEPGTEDDHDGAIRDTKVKLLFELHLAGVDLDRDAALLLDGIDLSSDDDFDQRFGVHSSAKAELADVGLSVPVELTDKEIDELADALANDSLHATQVDSLVLSVPDRVGEALRLLSERGVWPREAWKRLLWHLSSMRGEKKPIVSLEDDAAELLSNAPKALFKEVGVAASTLVRSIADHWGEGREPEFSELWKRAWIGACDGDGFDDANPVTMALNQVAGILGEAALSRLWKYQPTPGSRLPEPVQPYFETVANDPCGHLGRVMLASRLNVLFTIDPSWTRDHLLPLLDPSHSDTAIDLWAGFAWSPTIGPNLLEAFKKPFLSALQHEKDLAEWTTRPLVRLLITISLDVPKALTAEETRSVVQGLSEESLRFLLHSLRRRLTGEPQERKRMWNEKVRPWLQDYWPKERERNTRQTTVEMIYTIIECGSAFPERFVGNTRRHDTPVRLTGF